MSRTMTPTKVSATRIVSRLESLGWPHIVSDLDASGCAVARGVLLPEQCRALAALYDQDEPFRSRIVNQDSREASCPLGPSPHFDHTTSTPMERNTLAASASARATADSGSSPMLHTDTFIRSPPKRTALRKSAPIRTLAFR